MDVLSDVLQTLRLESTVFVHGEVARPWGIRTDPHPDFAFHVIARGTCILQVDDGAEIDVGPGDVVVINRGHGHSLRDVRSTALRPLFEFMESPGFHPPTGDANATQLVCGCFHFDTLPDDPLLASMPPFIHARDLTKDVGWLGETIKLLGTESSGDRPGGSTVVNRLCDALFVYVLRSFLASMPAEDESWLRAIVEPQIAPALRLIHEKPAEPWTVADLAAKSGMSRSAFSAHFTKVVGEAPMQYLTSWRLRKAASMLRATNDGIGAIASRVGYDSEAAFSKAFKRSIGVAPGAYRRSSLRA